MQERKICPICDNEVLEKQLSTTDYFGTQESFDLVACNQCQTLYTTLYPDLQESIKYYKSDSYVSHGDKKGFLFDNIYATAKWLNIHNKYKLLFKHIRSKSHLDIGCGTGDFLVYLKGHGIKTSGVEIDDSARAISKAKELKVYSELPEMNEDKFDSISMVHVLEHIHDLKEYMRFIKEHLNKKGILFLALPNHQSADAEYYKEYWAGYDVPRHLHHFSPKSISAIAQQFGLKLVATYPMKFDSYYASLLSHKYKTGSTNYFKAFIQGYKSNMKARKSGNFSSLIYILQK